MDSFLQQFIFGILGFFLIEVWVVVCSIFLNKKGSLDKEQHSLIIKPAYTDYFSSVFLIYVPIILLFFNVFDDLGYWALALSIIITGILISMAIFYGAVTYYFSNDGVKAYRNWDKKTTLISFADILHIEPSPYNRRGRFYRIRFFDLVKKRNRTILVREESHSNDKVLQEYFELNGVMYIRK